MVEIIDNFLTKEECLELIDIVKDDFYSSSVLGEQIEGYRTAQNTWIYHDTDLTLKIKEFISNKTNLPIENQEDLHIVKYNIGGQYKNHHDFFHPGEEYYDEVTKNGGQRAFSCLIYLNDDFTGGETCFPNKDITIKPELGKMIIWININEDNSLNYDSLHAGLPVISGEKLICIVWVREYNFK